MSQRGRLRVCECTGRFHRDSLMCLFPDAFRVDISLKDIKGTALSFTLGPVSASHRRSLLLSFPVLRSLLEYLSCDVYPLSALLPRVSLPCKPPAVVWHKNVAEDGKTFRRNCALYLVSSSLHHLLFGSLSLQLYVISFHINRNAFCVRGLMFVPCGEGLGSTSTALITLPDLISLFSKSVRLLFFFQSVTSAPNQKHLA